MNRRSSLVSLSVALLGIVIAVFVNILTGNQNFLNYFANVGPKALIGLVSLFSVLLLLATYLQHRYQLRADTDTRGSAMDFEASVHALIRSLRDRYKSRYEQKLDERFEISLEVSQFLDHSESVVISERFGSNPTEGEAMVLISNLYDETGRLLILGEPGFGKTVLLLKLASTLLDRMLRDFDVQRANRHEQPPTSLRKTQPFPVILNLASWSSEYKEFKDWLIAALRSGNGVSKDFATKLLDQNRIVVFLDGLDELAQNEDKASAADRRATCLQSLNDYLRRGRRAVVCCRRDEFLQLSELKGQKAPVVAKVVILKLTKAEVLLALQHAAIDNDVKHHASAMNLTALLVRDDYQCLLETLRIPFYFTTALELFDQQIPLDRRLPEDEEQLKRYLIEQFVETKIHDTPNPKGFNPTKTRKWLEWLAQWSQKRQLVTFELADLQPTDLRWRWLFHFLYGFVTYVLLSSPVVLFVLIMVLWDLTTTSQTTVGPLLNDIVIKTSSRFLGVAVLLVMFLVLALGVGAFAFLPFSLLFGFRTKSISTEDASRFSLRPLGTWEAWKSILWAVAFYGSLGLLVATMGSVIRPDFGAAFRQIRGTLLVLVVFVFMERVSNYCRVIRRFVSLKNDYQRLRTGLIHNFLRWQVVLLCLVFLGNCLEVARGNYPKGVIYRLVEFRSTVLILPFTVVLSVLNAVILKHFVLRACLVVGGRMPISYASFLNYAVALRILEKDGGHWRFRHENLKDYFLGKMGSISVTEIGNGP